MKIDRGSRVEAKRKVEMRWSMWIGDERERQSDPGGDGAQMLFHSDRPVRSSVKINDTLSILQCTIPPAPSLYASLHFSTHHPPLALIWTAHPSTGRLQPPPHAQTRGLFSLLLLLKPNENPIDRVRCVSRRVRIPRFNCTPFSTE